MFSIAGGACADSHLQRVQAQTLEDKLRQGDEVIVCQGPLGAEGSRQAEQGRNVGRELLPQHPGQKSLFMI